MLCAGVKGSRRSEPVANNFSRVFAAVANCCPPPSSLLHSLTLERDFLCCFFVKMTGPNRINKAPIFTWLLAG